MLEFILACSIDIHSMTVNSYEIIFYLKQVIIGVYESENTAEEREELVRKYPQFSPNPWARELKREMINTYKISKS